ncbi:MAG: oligosaccharide flippase family protein [Planctomycetes bacterium]|nr:oligosaccharide flippase family protein [Planctomycetota bacterium]
MTLILARALTKSDFGRYAFVATLLALLNAAIDFGGDLIGAREMSRTPEGAGGVVGVLLAQKALFALGGWVIAFAVLLGAGETATFSALTALAVFVYVLSPFEVVFQVKLESGVPVALHAIERLLFVALLGAFAAAGSLTFERAVLLFVATTGAGYAAVSIAGARRVKPGAPAPRIGAFLFLQTPQGIASLAAAAYYYLDTFYLRFFRGTDDVATYAAAYRIYSFGVLIPGMTMQALFPVLSALAHRADDESRERFAATYREALGKLLLVGLPALATAPALAPGVIGLLFPKGGYEGAVVPLVWLAAAFAVECVGSLSSHSVVALDGQMAWMRTTLLALTFNALGNLVAIPRFGPTGAAAMTFATEAFVAVACVLRVRAMSGATPFSRELRPAIVLAIGAGAGSLAALPFGFPIGLVGAALGAGVGALVLRIGR